MRISNCSRDFLSTCGLRSTVYTVLRVGSGTGPEVTAPVRRAVRTISAADWSSVAWSYDFSLIRIFCSILGPLLDDLGDDAGADGAAALADGRAQLLLHRDRRDQLHRHVHVVPRHHHLAPLRQRRHPRHVRRPEVELRPVAVEERRVPPALLLRHPVLGPFDLPCGVPRLGPPRALPRPRSSFSTPRSSSPTLSPAMH